MISIMVLVLVISNGFLAARSIVPIAELRTRMVMAGHSKGEIVSALKAGFAYNFDVKRYASVLSAENFSY